MAPTTRGSARKPVRAASPEINEPRANEPAEKKSTKRASRKGPGIVARAKGAFLSLKPWKQAAAVLAAPFALIWLYKRLLTIAAIDPTNVAARLTMNVVRSYSFGEDEFYSADGCSPETAEKRRRGFKQLAERFKMVPGGKMAAVEKDIADGLSDIRFTDTNRVPFQFQTIVREHLKVASVVMKSEGPNLVDYDGATMLDVSGSYGVNVAGYDEYKGFVERGWERVKDLGPNVLGPVHPVILDVIKPLRKISGLDEVSFHMSGTEAVMAAVRLARFNTQRRLVVTFGGAYHGWWDGMQPGAGNERFTSDVLSVKDMSPASMRLIKARANEIAAVLVSPLQGLNPNKPPPSDLVLLDAKVRKTNDKISDYTDWLKELRAATQAYDIPLIFDEVYTGFRMAPGGAQEYYNVSADYVVYGKTLGGGLPVGVVCGKKSLMHRFDKTHPLRVNYVIGTFAAAPMTLGAMAEFLDWQAKPATKQLYLDAEDRVHEFIVSTNKQFLQRALPLRVDSLTTVWTVLFEKPGRYHWMFQYYLRAEGLALSWVGTGRCLFSLDFTPAQYEQVTAALLAAGEKMKADGWWDEYAGFSLPKELLSALVGLR